MMADRDEDFNTRYGSYKGWQMAVSKVKPIIRDTANINFTAMIINSGAKDTSEAVDYLLSRFLIVNIDKKMRNLIIDFLNNHLGTNNIIDAETYLEDPLGLVVHLILSQPEYQLG